MLQAYIHTIIRVLLSSFSYAYHMRLIVQQTSILPELKHVKSPYPDNVTEQCFTKFPKGKKNDIY